MNKEDRKLALARRQYFKDNGIPEKPWLDQIEPAYKAIAEQWPRTRNGRISVIPKRAWNNLKRSDLGSLAEFALFIENGLPVFVKEIDRISLMRSGEVNFLKEVVKEYHRADHY